MIRKNEKGMTLVELLIVVAIIGIIAAIAVPNLLQSMQRSKISRTLADLSAIKSAIAAYLVDNNHYPIASDITFWWKYSYAKWEPLTHDLLPEKYYSSTLQDAWGNTFFYVSDISGQNYAIRSYGTDQLSNWWSFTVSSWYFSHTWWFKGHWSTICKYTAYEEMNKIIDEGCDLAIVNGVQAGVCVNNNCW